MAERPWGFDPPPGHQSNRPQEPVLNRTNRTRRLSVFLALLPVLLSCCTAYRPSVRVSRSLPTAIDTNDSLGILLNRYSECTNPMESANWEENFYRCLKAGIDEKHPYIRLVPPKDLRRNLFPDRSLEDWPRSPEEVLEYLARPESRAEVSRMGLRYLAILDVNTYKGPETTDFAAHDGGWGFSRTHEKSTAFSATVIDLRKYAKAGEVVSVSDGTEGYMMFFLVIVPMPPVPLLAPTEAVACGGLGRSIGDFLAEGGRRPFSE